MGNASNLPTLIDVTRAPLPILPRRRPDSHKGDYGRGLLVGGSRGMSGAIALAGRATLRSGAGLVTLAAPGVVQQAVAAFEPSYMTYSLPDDGEHFATTAVDDVIERAKVATVIGLGPGLGRCSAVSELVVRLYREISLPMVVDADALYALAERRDVIANPGGPRVLTPHPGEFARLTGRAYDAARRVEAAVELAQSSQAVVVLKGRHTVITDGMSFSLNQTGNPGMATGGTGDVLTGVITGLLCQGLSPFEAARLGAHVHGQAGDLGAAELGQVSLIASDLIEYLPRAFQSLNDV